MPPITFPALSRKAALKTRETTLDPTIRDAMENMAEATRAAATRFRRQFEISIDHLTPADVVVLRNFVEKIVYGGALNFLFQDRRDPSNFVNLNVRFSSLPAYVDDGNVEGQNRRNCTFTLREM